MPDQPLPTLANIEAYHRMQAVRARPKTARPWHEAAARQIKALAGQGREVEIRREEREHARAWLTEWSRKKMALGDTHAAALLLTAGGLLLIGRHMEEALATPPAEEPRERAGVRDS